MKYKPDSYKANGVTRAYQFYRREYKDKDTHFLTYSKITNAFNAAIMKKVVHGEIVLSLPHGTGRIVISKRGKAEDYRRPIDWVNTKKYGKRIYLTNEHTKGYSYSIFWLKENINVRGKRMYLFQPARSFCRALGAFLKDPNRTIDFPKYR